MQNHEILYTTATWGSVEDALEPARKLSVLANRHTKMDAYFCFVRATKFTKRRQKSNHRILYSTATWDSVPVAPVAAACVRNAMVNGFQNVTCKFQALWKREGTRDEAKAEDRRAKEVVHLYTHPTPDRPPPGGPVC